MNQTGKTRERIYQWYVEPLDSATNEALARELPEVDALRDVRDDRGILRNVYRVGSRMLSFLRNSRSQAHLRFRVYVREGHGKMRLAPFLPSKPKRTMIRSRTKAVS